MDATIKQNYELEVRRLQKELKELTPGSDEYSAVQGELLAAMNVLNEMTKDENARKGAKTDVIIRVATFVGGLVGTPIITYHCQKRLAKFIGTVEQMETFTTMPGRSISSWFRWK